MKESFFILSKNFYWLALKKGKLIHLIHLLSVDFFLVKNQLF